MKKYTFALMSIILITFTLNAQEEGENVIYEYKQYEKFDLGNLEIEGQIISPGDLSIQKRSRNDFSRNLFDRRNFKDFMKSEIKSSY